MLSLFRKSKPCSATGTNANTSETTLVSQKHAPKPKREYTYKPEFTGMGALGGIPSLAGMMFVEPPSPTESNSSKGAVKMVPDQPFKSSPRASFVTDRLDTVKGMFPSPSSTTQQQKRLSAQELVERLYAPCAVMIGGVVAPFPLSSQVKVDKNKVQS
ncbi:uncharacterized protein SPSC_03638 [Sporisorium scitamineum]|uniref:Uncharacterized protein n=1 Tax=Sporisorium scitamineum TaxID=49012 RepID=A0A0F7RSP4_9BASI|nr:uncharacterized protein SPSC_03638 [Sporisorium scitamineum]CDR99205.1 hypothetical protein [Sporisorium scitamineum]